MSSLATSKEFGSDPHTLSYVAHNNRCSYFIVVDNSHEDKHNTHGNFKRVMTRTTFDVVICSASGAWWDGSMTVDPSSLTLTTSCPSSSSSLPTDGSLTIPMEAVMFFAKVDPDAQCTVPSLMVEFEQGMNNSSVIIGGSGGSCIVEPGRLRLAPRHTDGTTSMSVERMWTVCCAMSTSVDMMTMERAFDNETDEGFTKHKRQRD